RYRSVTGVQTCALPICRRRYSALYLADAPPVYGGAGPVSGLPPLADAPAGGAEAGQRSPAGDCPVHFCAVLRRVGRLDPVSGQRSEEHTSELQSRFDLV